MRKAFFRYFISIFSIAVAVLLIQFGVLLLQYRTSQNRWKNEVYDDFVVSVERVMADGDFTDYGLNSIMMAVSNIGDDRVSGFLLRDADGQTHVMPEEWSFFETENRYQALVYYKGVTGRTWRLVAYQQIVLR